MGCSAGGVRIHSTLQTALAAALSTILLAACAKAPPAPADQKPATLLAWADRHAPEGKDWRRITLGDTAALLLDRSIRKSDYPLIRYRMKYENFEPSESDGHRFRSTAVTYEADCSRALHRIVRVTAYERLGLKGESFEAANPIPDWSTPEMGSDGYLLTATACTLAAPAAYDLDDPRLIRFEPQAFSSQEIAAAFWVRRNGLAGDGWSLIGSGPQSAEFIRDAEFDFDAYPLVRFDAKTEFFHQVQVDARVIRSEVRRVEVDCEKHRQRDLALVYYEGQNLSGAAIDAPGPGQWSAPDSALPLLETMACVFAYDLMFDRGLTTASAKGKDLF